MKYLHLKEDYKNSIFTHWYIFSYSGWEGKAFYISGFFACATTATILADCYQNKQNIIGYLLKLESSFLEKLGLWLVCFIAWLFGKKEHQDIEKIRIQPLAAHNRKKLLRWAPIVSLEEGDIDAPLLEEPFLYATPNYNCGYIDERVNRILRGKKPLTYTVRDEFWRRGPDYKEGIHDFTVACLREKLKQGIMIRNDRKVRMASEIKPDQNGIWVKLQPTDYIETISTGDLGFSQITYEAVGRERELTKPTSRFMRKEKEEVVGLLDYDKNFTTNQIGISAFLFTLDGNLVLGKQSKRNNQSAQTATPTGSGSLDWNDLPSPGEGDFMALLHNGAKRELVEETFLSDYLKKTNIEIDMSPLFMLKLVHRGAKPEFFFIGFIPVNSGTIQNNLLSAESALSCVATLNLEHTLSTSPYHISLAEMCDEILELIHDRKGTGQRIQASFQFECGIWYLRRLCEADPNYIESVVSNWYKSY